MAQRWPCFRTGVTETNGFGRFLQLKFPVLPCLGFPVLAILWAPWNCSTWRNSASLIHTVTLKLTAAQCRLSPPPSATHPVHHLSGLASQPGVAVWRLQPWICCWLPLRSKVGELSTALAWALLIAPILTIQTPSASLTCMPSAELSLSFCPFSACSHPSCGCHDIFQH